MFVNFRLLSIARALILMGALTSCQKQSLPASLSTSGTPNGVVSIRTNAKAVVVPVLPQVFIDTTYSRPGGQVISVPNGGDFQAALNLAQPGDIIELAAGAIYTGNFQMPLKSGNGWIYIQSSAYRSLPAPGVRVGPGDAANMPKIVSTNPDSTLTTVSMAHHYRFVGIEITTAYVDLVNTVYNIILIGNRETDYAQLPHDITFDRCYIHGNPNGNTRRGLSPNGASIALIDSYVTDIHEIGSDAQAVCAWNGSGPFKIVNNYLAAATENIMFGGAATQIAGIIPSDIEIRHNHIFKSKSWDINDPSYTGFHWSIKNLFELKNAQRVLFDGNILENNWLDSQVGFGILMNGGGLANYIQNITITNNYMLNSAQGINIGANTNGARQTQPSNNFVVANNLFVGLYGDGIGFQIIGNNSLGGGPPNVAIDHNTVMANQTMIVNASSLNFSFTNNITDHGRYGIYGDGVGEGNAAVSTYFPGGVVTKNVMALNLGGDPSWLTANYPAGNFFPPDDNSIGFVDIANGNYGLSGSSPYKNAGTDGKDLGVDMSALNASLAGVRNGNNTSPLPLPVPVPTPAPAPVPTSNSGSDGNSTLSSSSGPLSNTDFAHAIASRGGCGFQGVGMVKSVNSSNAKDIMEVLLNLILFAIPILLLYPLRRRFSMEAHPIV